MRFLSSLWLKAAAIFDPIQYFFNRDFWGVFVSSLSDFSNKTLLDLACGPGELRNHINPKKYIGVDINESYINYAKKRYMSKENTLFVNSDITKYYTKDRIDVAVFISAAHHFSDDQMIALFKMIKRNSPKRFILVDGVPNEGIFSGILFWLDDVLGGGKYFRTEKELKTLMTPYLKVEASGVFRVPGSFYYYPYVVAK